MLCFFDSEKVFETLKYFLVLIISTVWKSNYSRRYNF